MLYVPSPLTVTVSVSNKVSLGLYNVNVIEPVGSSPPDSVAVSIRVTDVPHVALVVLGLVVIVGLARPTTTCSALSLSSVAALLFLSPL